MADILPTDMTGFGTRAVVETTLGASDTFTYDKLKRQVIILDNQTAGALTPNIDGDGAGSVEVGGVGPVDISGGYSTGEIAAGNSIAIPLTSIDRYLSGIIDVTGGTGIVASLLEF